MEQQSSVVYNIPIKYNVKSGKFCHMKQNENKTPPLLLLLYDGYCCMLKWCHHPTSSRELLLLQGLNQGTDSSELGLATIPCLIAQSTFRLDLDLKGSDMTTTQGEMGLVLTNTHHIHEAIHAIADLKEQVLALPLGWRTERRPHQPWYAGNEKQRAQDGCCNLNLLYYCQRDGLPLWEVKKNESTQWHFSYSVKEKNGQLFSGASSLIMRGLRTGLNCLQEDSLYRLKYAVGCNPFTHIPFLWRLMQI